MSSRTVPTFTHTMPKHDQHDMPHWHWLPQPLCAKTIGLRRSHERRRNLYTLHTGQIQNQRNTNLLFLLPRWLPHFQPICRRFMPILHTWFLRQHRCLPSLHCLPQREIQPPKCFHDRGSLYHLQKGKVCQFVGHEFLFAVPSRVYATRQWWSESTR